MKWKRYSNLFREKALSFGFSEVQIERCLNYAINLFQKNFPIIYDQTHLSLLVGYSNEFLLKASNSPESFYRKFKIPKKSGGVREIAEPLPSLKEIQKWILKEILYKCKTSEYSKAFSPGSSIKNNARFHKSQELVLSLDIKNFFGSLKYRKVRSLFQRLGYSNGVSTMLANLCCLEGNLPQGASTSPMLSNLLTYNIDKRISGFIKKYGIRYSRYADDLSFSGKFEPGSIIKFVRKVLAEEKLLINYKKIRLMHRHQRQEVTGIVVNQHMQVPINLRKKLRQAIYYMDKYGLNSHLDRIKCSRAHYVQHLLGIANFIYFINPADKKCAEYIEKLKKYSTDFSAL